MRWILLTTFFLFTTAKAQDLANLVNPFVGTGGHGHTFPGATLPFGMVQLSPDTRVDGSWDGCSGYHYSDSIIYGFSHTHLSGTGVSDYGDIMLMPVKGAPQFNQKDYASKFSHSKEKATAGYYSVFLDKPGIKAELTTTTRVGIHKYTPLSGNRYSFMLDLTHRDELMDFEINVVSATRIEGFRRSKAWAADQRVFYVMEFSKPMTGYEFNTEKNKAGFEFDLVANESIQVKVGISFVSVEGASKNMAMEVKGFDFELVKLNAQAKWQKELSKIEVSNEDTIKRQIFYTALYHCMMHPNIATDVDSNYRGHDQKIHKATNHVQYTVFSLWDTYRALHPLLTIIDTKRTGDFINSFLEIYAQGGRLPVWELCNNETDCMIGYHSVSVIADAYTKGIRNFDWEFALDAMMTSANAPIFGLPSYNKYGYVRAEDEAESVSKNLEYAYDDWCISQFSEAYCIECAHEFENRSGRWRNSFNGQTGFMTPRINDNWLQNFDPKQVNNHFTEANSWQYSFYVPHDIPGLIKAHGGKANFEKKLDQLFSESTQTTGREQSDITGLIGQYAHGNEPSHHIAYLYNYVDKPYKTQALVNKICDSFYTLKPDGLIGNEDCGQMSAWYVLSASGFYPVTPGSGDYQIGVPQFNNVTYNLENGSKFNVIGENKSIDHTYAMALSPVYYNAYSDSRTRIEHQSILKGDTLKMRFSAMPKPFDTLKVYKKPWGISAFRQTPLIVGDRVFEGNQRIEIISQDSGYIYYYTSADSSIKLYNEPLLINNTITIYSFTEKVIFPRNRYQSPIAQATFYKKQNKWKVETYPASNPQYTAGGNDALVDGIRGTANWRAGGWQGYQDTMVGIIIKLDKRTRVSELELGFLQDARSWILLPTAIEFSTGHFWCGLKKGGKRVIEINAFTDSSFVDRCVIKSIKPRKAKFIIITMKSAGKLPEGHPGHTMNGDSFIFIDEVVVR